MNWLYSVTSRRLWALKITQHKLKHWSKFESSEKKRALGVSVFLATESVGYCFIGWRDFVAMTTPTDYSHCPQPTFYPSYFTV